MSDLIMRIEFMRACTGCGMQYQVRAEACEPASDPLKMMLNEAAEMLFQVHQTCPRCQSRMNPPREEWKSIFRVIEDWVPPKGQLR